MPLTNAQIDFIQGSIDHLLEFPPNKDELLAGVQLLKAQTIHAPAKEDNNNVFAVLARCLRSPENAFQRLDEYGSEATIQDVRECIIASVALALEKAANDGNTSLADIGWDAATRKSLLAGESPDSLFNTVKVDYQIPLPWENIHYEDSIFSCDLSLNESRSHVLIKITVTLPNQPDPIVFNETLIETPAKDFDEYYYLKKQIKAAIVFACPYVVALVCTHLIHNKLLGHGDIEHLEHNDYLFPLVTDKIIASLLLNRQIAFAQFLHLNKTQASQLLRPAAKSLVQSGLCTLEEACDISRSISDLMQVYTSLVQQRRITVSQFQQLNNDKHKQLKHPLIVNLVHKSKLTFSDAAAFPSFVLPLFSSALYGDHFMTATIDWHKLTKKSHVAILLNPSIANSIHQGLLTVNNVLHASKHRRHKLRMHKIATLLTNKTLSLKQIDKLALSKCELLDKHPLMSEWLRLGIISINDINLRSLIPLYTTAFSNRAKAILENKPYHLYVDRPDSIQHMLEEIELAQWHAKTETISIHSHVVEKIIQHLKQQIDVACLGDTKPFTKPLHQQLNKFIAARNTQTQTPQAFLADLIEKANQLNKPTYCSIHLFGGQHADADTFDLLCRGINKLRDLAAPAQVNHYDSRPHAV